MSVGHPIVNGWNEINVNGVAYLTRTWLKDVGGICKPTVDITACGYINASEFLPGSSLANFVGVNAPQVGDFINVYDFTQVWPQGNHGSNCIEILDIINQNTYSTGTVHCPGPFAGFYQGNINSLPNCPCTIAGDVPQQVTVGSHVNSPFSIYPVYTQGGVIPLSWRYPDCQTCIEKTPTQDCGCTSTTLKPVSNGGSTGTWPSLPASNFVNQWGSHAVQPCCTLCDGTDDNDCCVWPSFINPNPATTGINAGVNSGCKDPNAWNFCLDCTHDCATFGGAGAYLMGPVPWINTNTSCCRYSCPPPPVPKPTWDCCTYITCPETFQLHYGPNSVWGIANPGQPTPSVNANSKFCQERFDGTGQYSTLQACKNNCNSPGPVLDGPKGYSNIKFNRKNPNCPDGWEHLMSDGNYMCGKTHPGGRSIRDMIRSNFNL